MSAGALWAMSKPRASYLSAGADFSQATMLIPMLDENLPAYAADFELPMVIIEGSGDLVTPEAKAYFDEITAPHKEYLTLPDSGHLAIFTNPAGFLSLLIAHVLPLTKK